MTQRIPDWPIQASWWASGIFATGAAWYFLSQGNYVYTGFSAGGAIAFAALAVFLHHRKDNWDRQHTHEVHGRPRVPAIYGESYVVARALLIREGWVPRTRHWSHGETIDVQSGNGPHFWEKGYHELAYCSGTGYALCRFEFTDAVGDTLVVITAGEAGEDGDENVRVFRIMLNPQNEEGAYGETLGQRRISAREFKEVLEKVKRLPKDN